MIRWSDFCWLATGHDCRRVRQRLGWQFKQVMTSRLTCLLWVLLPWCVLAADGRLYVNDKPAPETRADLEAIFRSLSDGIMMLDKAGTLIRSNAAAARICSCLAQHLQTPQNCPQLNCDGACRQLIQESLNNGVPGKLERIRCQRPQKLQQVVTITTSPIRDHADNCTGIVVVLRDETRVLINLRHN